MVWQKIDDQFGISRKVIRIPKRQRLAAIGLWTLGGNYSVRALTDGVLEVHELEELGAPASVVAELVRVELWHAHGHSCASCTPVPPGGAVIHDFLHYNPSKARVLEEREAERVRKASQRDKRRTPSGSDLVSEIPGPVPVPSRPLLTDMTNDTESSQVPRGELPDADEDLIERLKREALVEAETLRIADLGQARATLESVIAGRMTLGAAVELAGAIISRSKRPVQDGDAYIATVCRTTPREVRELAAAIDLEAIA